MAYSQDKTNLADTISKQAQRVSILDRDFKSTVLNMFKGFKKTMDKQLKKTRRMTAQQIKNIIREIDIINTLGSQISPGPI